MTEQPVSTTDGETCGLHTRVRLFQGQSPWTQMGLAGQLGTQPTHSPHSAAAVFVHALAPTG